ncbi:alpha/beta hydrolase [Labedaea rhizosphaerae]|uniref:Serine aminopeptidase S33 family n=1 Tax=Labedaea rhizosphaerae TaxID=598644 RepID=A0A4R6SG64_LABRH|nr:alpha/beta hydrolase [Labedaea rhizosphaerae]TDQ00644.1 serine aminopeptidase S33 family [Labedaea rhizosphaerae]
MFQAELVSADGITLEAAVHAARGGVGRRTVIQVHGINADMTEGGMFVRLADRLADNDCDVLRFSFRGHGNSGGTSRGATIAGEMLDLEAAVAFATARFSGVLSLVASSFGAVSACLALPWLAGQLEKLVLWNPVLDLARTFVRPELPWGKDNFGPAQQKSLWADGFLTIDDEFEIGRVLFAEFDHYRPLDRLMASPVETLIVHGDRDSAVSYDIARAAADEKPGTVFHTVAGSDHGFDTREREDEAVGVTVQWIASEDPR